MKTKNYLKFLIPMLSLAALLLTAFTGQLAFAKLNSNKPFQSSAPAAITASQVIKMISKPVSISVKSSSQPAQTSDIQPTTGTSGSGSQSESDGETVITGTVTAINGNMWTINGVTVIVDFSTEIESGAGVGTTVKVEGTFQSDGTFLAHEIETTSAENDQGENEQGEDLHESSTAPQPGSKVEFSGQLTAINGEVWTIGGVSVIVTSSTEISGSPVAGDTVKVEGTVNSNNTIQASEVKVSEGSSGSDEHDDGSSSSTSSSSVDESHSSGEQHNNEDVGNQGDGGD